jgi:hypothetical protein
MSDYSWQSSLEWGSMHNVTMQTFVPSETVASLVSSLLGCYRLR